MFKIPAFVSLFIDSAIILWQIHLLKTTAIILNFHHEVIYFDVCLAGIILNNLKLDTINLTMIFFFLLQRDSNILTLIVHSFVQKTWRDTTLILSLYMAYLHCDYPLPTIDISSLPSPKDRANIL